MMRRLPWSSAALALLLAAAPAMAQAPARPGNDAGVTVGKPSILRKLGLTNRVQAAIEARAWLARHPDP